MNTKTLLLCLIVLLFLDTGSTNAQVNEHVYSMLPICNMEQELSKVPFKSDTCYVFHLKPNTCPRCEYAIFELAKVFRAKGIQPYIIIDVSSKILAQDYLNNNPVYLFGDRIFIDTAGAFRRFVDYNNSKLNIPFIYKLSQKSGKFFLIEPLLSNINDSIVNSWINKKDFISCNKKAKVYQQTKTENKYPSTAVWDKVTELKVANESITEPNGIFLTNDYVGFVDAKANKAFAFNLDDFSSRTYFVDSSEFFLRYDNKSLDVYNCIVDGKKTGFLHVIYLSVSKIDSSIINITTSVPNIKIKYKGTDTIIEYRNSATTLIKGLDNTTIDDAIINIPLNNDLTYSHYSYQVYPNGLQSIITVKGWPATGSYFSDKMKDDSKYNPFLSDFYNHSPRIGIFDEKGALIGNFGELPQKVKELQLGYYYGGLISFIDTQYLLITDVVWGEVQLIKMKDVMNNNNIVSHSLQLMPYKNDIKSNRISNYPNRMDYLKSYMPQLFNEYIVGAGVLNEAYWYFILYNKDSSKLTLNIISKKGFIKKEMFSYNVLDQTFKTFKIFPNNDGEGDYKLLGVSVHSKKVYLLEKVFNID